MFGKQEGFSELILETTVVRKMGKKKTSVGTVIQFMVSPNNETFWLRRKHREANQQKLM